MSFMDMSALDLMIARTKASAAAAGKVIGRDVRASRDYVEQTHEQAAAAQRRKERAIKRARETIHVSVDLEGVLTRRQLKEYADDFYKEWEKELKEVTRLVELDARYRLKPRNITGVLEGTLKTSVRRTGARLEIGTEKRVAYAAPAHWGWSGKKTQDWFLFRVVYPQAQPGLGNAGPVAPWIVERLQKAVNKARDDINRKGGVFLGGA